MSIKKQFKPSLIQERIINSNHSRILVVATAGSGKTQTLIQRYKRLVSESLESKSNIAICSFTNKAVDEINMRLLPEERSEEITTFHKFCNSILKASNLMQEHMNTNKVVQEAIHSIEFETHRASPIKSPDILRAINLVMNHIPWHSHEDVSLREKDVYLFLQKKNYSPELIYPYVKRYLEILEEKKIIDFNSGLQLTLWAIKNNINGLADILKKKFKHCFFDESQDFSIIQWLIVFELEKLGINLFLVGDDAQCIYKFRGAEPSVLKRVFENEKWEKHLLDVNYRSHTEIVLSSDLLCKNSVNGIEKKSLSFKGEGGAVYTMPHMLGHFMNWARDIHLDESKGSGAIIVRTNKLREMVEMTLNIAGIKFKVLERHAHLATPPKWTEPLYPLISWLEVILDDTKVESFVDALNAPMRLDIKIANDLRKKIKDKGIKTISEAILKLEFSDDNGTYANFAKELEYFRNQINVEVSGVQYINDLLKKDLRATTLKKTIMSSCEYYANPSRKKAKSNNYVDDYFEADNLPDVSIASLIELAHEGAREILDVNKTEMNLSNYLKAFYQVIVRKSLTEGDSRLFLSTVHQAKGLEFDEVYLPYFQEGIVPMTFENVEIGSGPDPDEERRIAYVALTRARKVCYISYEESIPSHFIREVFDE